MRLPVIGIDISQEWFDIHVTERNHKERFSQDIAGFKLLLKCLKKLRIGTARFCMEATGLYYESLAEFLHANGHEVVVVNPQVIKAFAKSELRRSKSDPLDAALIGSFCEEKYEKQRLWAPPPEHLKHCRELLRRREALIRFRTAEMNRLKAGFSCDDTLKSIHRIIDVLNDEIREIEKLAWGIIKSDPEFKSCVDLADSVPGVARLTAMRVLLETPRELWTGRLAATHAGVTPSKCSSGKSSTRTKMSRVGNAHLRDSLYMAAVTASWAHPILSAFYRKLLARGLKPKQALTAVMRKLLHHIFGVIKTGQPFDPLYESKRKLA